MGTVAYSTVLPAANMPIDRLRRG